MAQETQPMSVRRVTRDGAVYPVGKEMSLEEIAAGSLEEESLAPYDGANPEFILSGKNNLQAAIATLARDAAAGLEDARKELLDRVLGKPMQRAEISTKNVTLIGFLDNILAEEGGEANGVILEHDFPVGKSTQGLPTFEE